MPSLVGGKETATGDYFPIQVDVNGVVQTSDGTSQTTLTSISTTLSSIDGKASLLAKYAFSNADTADATYYYIGKEDKDGNWFIMRIAKADYSTQYAVGTSAYSTAWTNRATQSYGSFSSKF